MEEPEFDLLSRHLEEYPWRLEYGTLNVLGVAGLYAGVKWIKEQGIENIHQREMQLWKIFVMDCGKSREYRYIVQQLLKIKILS